MSEASREGPGKSQSTETLTNSTQAAWEGPTRRKDRSL